jgi:hypothetical protein
VQWILEIKVGGLHDDGFEGSDLERPTEMPGITHHLERQRDV